MALFSARDGIGIAAFCTTALAIAMIGGGWWVLGRVDPVIAIPGVGWASFALTVIHRAASPLRLALLAALASGLIVILAAVVQVGAFDYAQAPLLLACAALIAAAFGAVRRDLTRRGATRFIMVLCGIAASVVLANGAPRLCDPLYTSAAPDQPARIVLVSSLPLSAPVADIGAAVRNDALPHAAMRWLTHRYVVDRRDVVTPEIAASGRVLVLAHPAALPPASLVSIDGWVRRGGRALILADALSSWPPPYPLGDARNPPITSLLSPLLSHWGLQLDAPVGLAEAPATVRAGRHRLTLFSPGTLANIPAAEARCTVHRHGHIADCTIGRGRAVIVADADWLDAAHWAAAGTSPQAWHSGNMLWLTEQIDALAGLAGSGPKPWLSPMWADWPGRGRTAARPVPPARDIGLPANGDRATVSEQG